MKRADWSVTVRLAEIGQGLRRELSADEPARARIARDLDLVELPRLEGTVEVAPRGRGWRVTGRVDAEVVQTCGVTLEPLPAHVESRFELDVVGPEDASDDEAPAEYTLETIDTPDVAEGGVLDLAGYLVEHLALALDPFPRKPGAVFEPPATAPEPSPFAVLSQLRKPEPEG